MQSRAHTADDAATAKKHGGRKKKPPPPIPALVGTLKVEILKPTEDTWENVGLRLRVLRRIIGPALNETMRLLYPRAMAHVRGEPAEKSLETAVYAAAVKDGKCLALALERDRGITEKSVKGADTSRSHAPLLAAVADATAKGIVARFRGQHLKDLQQGRASIPSWKVGAPLVARAHDCAVSGPPGLADLAFPLWKSGDGATTLRVVPGGASARATWTRLVSGEYKLGAVALKYDERRRKWYALISWTGAGALRPSAGQAASANFGVHTFVYVVAEDGAQFNVPGSDIIWNRRRAWHRRSEIQKNNDTRGVGGRRHGKPRALQAVTYIEDADQRFSATKNRQVAAALVAWCQRHGVGRLYLEDLSELRDGVGADEHAEVKRLVHSWPFFALRKDVERAAERAGTVEVRSCNPAYDSQRCPWCDHTSPANVMLRPGRVEFLSHHGRTWERSEKKAVFECVRCHGFLDGDAVTCINHLKKVGHTVPPRLVKEWARKQLETELAVASDADAAEE